MRGKMSTREWLTGEDVFMGHTTRREFMKESALLGAACSLAENNLLFAATMNQQSVPTSQSPSQVSLSWVGEKPPASTTGISFAYPGRKEPCVRIHGSACSPAAELRLQVQSWPMAYWPDAR